ncbi:MAG: M48 family metallopeptidase [Synergistaceae bacterium]|jgi:heat shock protein HtpX|nr:M48 family metallopeptidase [Synergistaceae bacterium]
MNVYDHIDANNRGTFLILCAFPAALFVLLFLACLLTVGTGVPFFAERGVQHFFEAKDDGFLEKMEARSAMSTKRETFQTSLRLTLSIYPWMLLAAFLWIAVSYRLGGEMILRVARARPMIFEENRELFRLVENTAIMAGLPTPRIHLINDESLNAFATGRGPENASIALTKGLVERLSKIELQGVIAHELAHIGNRDTRLMTLTVAGIGCFTFFGELLFQGTVRGFRGRRRNGRIQILFFFLGAVCLVFGYVVAPVLRFALSRRREYQADATAAKITHDPEALARALEKILEDPRVEVLDGSPMVGNLCVADPAEYNFLTRFTARLYATHPPIEDRVRVLREMLGKPSLARARKPLGRVLPG